MRSTHITESDFVASGNRTSSLVLILFFSPVFKIIFNLFLLIAVVRECVRPISDTIDQKLEEEKKNVVVSARF